MCAPRGGGKERRRGGGKERRRGGDKGRRRAGRRYTEYNEQKLKGVPYFPRCYGICEQSWPSSSVTAARITISILSFPFLSLSLSLSSSPSNFLTIHPCPRIPALGFSPPTFHSKVFSLLEKKKRGQEWGTEIIVSSLSYRRIFPFSLPSYTFISAKLIRSFDSVKEIGV